MAYLPVRQLVYVALVQRSQGEILGVNWDDKELVKFREKHGQAVADLLMQKRGEMEEWNPSGHYPVTVSPGPCRPHREGGRGGIKPRSTWC
jgi:hypothetical protein